MDYRTRSNGFFSVSNSKLLLIIGTFITIFMSVNLIKAVDENRDVQDRINKLQNDLTVLDEQNKTLSQTFEYVQTDLFTEEEARNKLNYKKEGETVVSLPPEKADVREEIQAEYEQLQALNNRPNAQKWWDYFFAPAQAAEVE
ncbi:MAG TPA: septum formation initiator family protein [bacterium]|nr:septum formation initiator family protein [bacterium]